MKLADWEAVRDALPQVGGLLTLDNSLQRPGYWLVAAGHYSIGLLKTAGRQIISALVYDSKIIESVVRSIGNGFWHSGKSFDDLFQENQAGPLFRDDFRSQAEALAWMKEVSLDRGLLFDAKLRMLGPLRALASEAGPPE